MSKILVLAADGFEETELVTVVDVLRRAELQVEVAGLARKWVTGAHQITVRADSVLDVVDASEFDALVLPGGLPGAHRLRDDPRVIHLVQRFDAEGKWLAAICAAPIVFEAAGVLRGRRATSYPGQSLASAEYVEEGVVRDGRLITSRGVGTALPFALELVVALCSAAASQQLAAALLVSD